MKRRLWFSLLISALFLWIALRGLDLREVGEQLRGNNYFWLVPGMLAYFVTVGARAWRWSLLLRPLRPVPARRLYSVVVIGYLVNNIYPLRIGELVRAYLLRHRERVPIGSSLATVFVERLFDGLTMLAFVFVALPLASLASGSLRSLLILSSALFFGALFLFLVLASRPEAALRLLDVVLRILPASFRAPLYALGQRFLGGLGILQRWQSVAALFLVSIGVWLLELLKYWFIIQIFPLSLDLASLLLLLGTVNLASTLPSAPGSLGTFDAPGIALLVWFGAPAALAGAIILVMHAALWLPSVVVGFIFMIHEGLHWSELEQAAQVERKFSSS